MIFLIAMAAAWLILLSTLLIFGIRKVLAGWPSTEGEILSSDLGLPRIAESEEGTTEIYRPHIVYQYSVGGQRFTGNRFERYSDYEVRDKLWLTVRESDEWRTKFEAGMRVCVYYNPSDPAMSYLIRQSPLRALIIGILAALGFVGVGLYSLTP